nr:L348 [uncultured bacterium]
MPVDCFPVSTFDCVPGDDADFRRLPVIQQVALKDWGS